MYPIFGYNSIFTIEKGLMKKIKAYGICLYRELPKRNIEILLCKSVQSEHKWGLLKGVARDNEHPEKTAQREFYEESSILVQIYHYEKYFEQINKEKDIGIWLVNAKNVPNYENYFYNSSLHPNYLSWENSKARFFNIEHLPFIKKKQTKILKSIQDYFHTIYR